MQAGGLLSAGSRIEGQSSANGTENKNSSKGEAKNNQSRFKPLDQTSSVMT